jgi:hypothetical protein
MVPSTEAIDRWLLFPTFASESLLQESLHTSATDDGVALWNLFVCKSRDNLCVNELNPYTLVLGCGRFIRVLLIFNIFDQ